MKTAIRIVCILSLLYGLPTTAAEQYTPNCPSGSTLKIKNNAKDVCKFPEQNVIEHISSPKCISDTKLVANAVLKKDTNWRLTNRSGRDICIHRFEDKTKAIKCGPKYDLVINAEGDRDMCHKIKKQKATKRKISCNSSADKHKKKGRDVCIKPNF